MPPLAVRHILVDSNVDPDNGPTSHVLRLCWWNAGWQMANWMTDGIRVPVPPILAQHWGDLLPTRLSLLYWWWALLQHWRQGPQLCPPSSLLSLIDACLSSSREDLTWSSWDNAISSFADKVSLVVMLAWEGSSLAHWISPSRYHAHPKRSTSHSLPPTNFQLHTCQTTRKFLPS